MPNTSKKTKILAFRVTASDHHIIKTEAAKRDVTIRELMLLAVKKYLSS